MKKIIFFSAVFILAISSSCNKETDISKKEMTEQSTLKTFAKNTFYIGEHFGGGIIFYIDETGKHGLIAAFIDQEEPARWSIKDILNGAKDTAIGKGLLNSNRIFKIQGFPQNEGNEYAAIVCLQIQENGYQDWYLPSKNELNELYKQKNIVGHFTPFAYWSSSEADISKAWFENFGNGLQMTQIKSAAYALRPIRKF